MNYHLYAFCSHCVHVHGTYALLLILSPLSNSLNILAIRRHIVADIRGDYPESEDSHAIISSPRPSSRVAKEDKVPLSYQKLVSVVWNRYHKGLVNWVHNVYESIVAIIATILGIEATIYALLFQWGRYLREILAWNEKLNWTNKQSFSCVDKCWIYY